MSKQAARRGTDLPWTDAEANTQLSGDAEMSADCARARGDNPRIAVLLELSVIRRPKLVVQDFRWDQGCRERLTPQ
jgi:hypothetical protein